MSVSLVVSTFHCVAVAVHDTISGCSLLWLWRICSVVVWYGVVCIARLTAVAARLLEQNRVRSVRIAVQVEGRVLASAKVRTFSTCGRVRLVVKGCRTGAHPVAAYQYVLHQGAVFLSCGLWEGAVLARCLVLGNELILHRR